MSRFKRIKIIITSFILIITSSFANDKALDLSKIENIVKSYLEAKNLHDKKKIKKLTTNDFYQRLNKDNHLDRLFKLNKPQKIQYEIEIIKSKIVKGLILAKVKEKDSHDSITLEVIAHKDSYKISNQLVDDHDH